MTESERNMEKPKFDTAEFQNGLTLIMAHGAILAMLPLEDWLEAFSRAEAIAPIMDPTLYRQWLYSVNSEIIPDLLRAALAFKLAIKKAQDKILEDLEKKAARAEAKA